MKFTLLVLYVVFPVMVAIVKSRPGPSVAERHGTCRPRYLLTILLTSLCIINLGYGCQGTCRLLGSYDFQSRLFRGESPGVVARA